MQKSMKFLMCVALLFVAIAANAAPEKDWTVLIYINGNNNLHASAVKNIKEMEKVGSNDRMNIVVQWASQLHVETERMLIQKSNDPSKVTSPVVQSLKNVDMGDYKSLKDFIRWGVENYPAKHYFIEVWDHGDGWHAKELPINMRLDISRDEFTHHMINTPQLGQTMKYAAGLIGHNVDIYGSDACLMAMAEVADEMVDSVDYFVGSERPEPDSGWPYGRLLSQWQATPDASASDVVKILVHLYVEARKNEKEVTLSAYDMSKFPAFNKSVSDLAENIHGLSSSDLKRAIKAMNKADRTEVKNDKDGGITFKDYADLLDTLDKLTAAHVPGLDPKLIAAVQAAADQVIIAAENVNDPKHMTGMSIWLPSYLLYQLYEPAYRELKFDHDTRWGDMLERFFRG